MLEILAGVRLAGTSCLSEFVRGCMSEVFGSTTKTCVELFDVVLLNAAKTKSLALATL